MQGGRVVGTQRGWGSTPQRVKRLGRVLGARESGLQVEESAVRPVGAEVPVTRSPPRSR